MKTKPISSQALEVAVETVRANEGSETRGTVKTMMPPRAPCIHAMDDDIVRHSNENRRSSLNGYYNRKRVSHVLSLIRPAHGNVLAQEAVNGTMHLLRILERGLFFARSDLSSLQFDGYEKLLQDLAPAGNIIDLRGKPLSEDVLTDGALTVQDAPNYGLELLN